MPGDICLQKPTYAYVAESHDNRRKPKIGRTELAIAILAKMRLKNFGHRDSLPFRMQLDICPQEPTHVYVAEPGGS